MAKGKNLRLMETFNLNNVVNFVLLFFCKIEVLYKDGYFFALELEARCIGPLIWRTLLWKRHVAGFEMVRHLKL
jgi:hypothetical protein